MLCGGAGAYLSTGYSAPFIREMTAGKGYLALPYILTVVLLAGFIGKASTPRGIRIRSVT